MIPQSSKLEKLKSSVSPDRRSVAMLKRIAWQMDEAKKKTPKTICTKEDAATLNRKPK